LQQEVEALGFKTDRVFQTGVELTASVTECIRLNLNLRTASQVMYSLKSFICNDPDELYRQTLGIPWERLIARNGYFSVTSNVYHPTISTNLYANLRVKDAIVDTMRRASAIRPSTGSDLVAVVVNLFWNQDQAELFLDTSGESLARHGYRKLPGTAPMLEALAAATILRTRWDRQSTFINPMCGSGTLAIEAALMASKRYPGLYRDEYAFQHILGYDAQAFLAKKKKLESKIIHDPGVSIIASDISLQAISFAQENAAYAGVEHMIDFQVCDFAETEIPERPRGVIMFNPEYGERLGENAELEITYKRMGDYLKQKCAGYRGYIFTGNLELAKKVGLKASRRIEFWNGTIDCRLLKYDLYEGRRSKQ
jgi:putative N6-adenine-specific DNA methylase